MFAYPPFIYHDYFYVPQKFIPINIIQLCFRRCPGMFVHILFLLWFSLEICSLKESPRFGFTAPVCSSW